MTVADAPAGFDHRQWDQYVTLWTWAIVFTVFGILAAVGGFVWGMNGLAPAIVETAEGVTIVEGGAERGWFLGPVVSVVGVSSAMVGYSALGIAVNHEVDS